MSAAFKNSKKKISQTELRKFMTEHKNKSQKDVKKIDSPLAKYNEAGQLTCLLCKSVVRSEAVWIVHVNAKQHRENVELAKKLKEKTNNFTTPLKRPLTPPMEVPMKKMKGILKNSNSDNETEIVSSCNNNNVIPDDFFDDKSKIPVVDKNLKQQTMETDDVQQNPEKIPEGFFDDPKLDAKARNLEYRDPVEEEWERFQKEIREANFASAAIIAEDQEEATNERQIDEIDEQIKNWSRVVNLEKRKVEVISSVNDNNNKMDTDDVLSGDEQDFDEYLDWRSKKSFK